MEPHQSLVLAGTFCFPYSFLSLSKRSLRVYNYICKVATVGLDTYISCRGSSPKQTIPTNLNHHNVVDTAESFSTSSISGSSNNTEEGFTRLVTCSLHGNPIPSSNILFSTEMAPSASARQCCAIQLQSGVLEGRCRCPV
jgi:hypothetical protein